jgi:hypothetical protein
MTASGSTPILSTVSSTNVRLTGMKASLGN